ncbi:DUF4139 domain-containing protein [bacterium]|nr:DUF4139 domain-containing protein [bacterium]
MKNGYHDLTRHVLATALFLACAALSTGAAGAEDLLGSDAGDRRELQLTVYNHDLALVREVRRIDLPKGTFGLEFRDVPARINPVTLLVTGDGGTGLTVLEQNYEFDLLSPERILAKYVGRQISWIQEDGSRVTGTLLGTNSGPVYEVDGEVVFEVPGRIALPSLPGNLRARPTLVWTAHSEKSGAADVDASYLTGGISWQADYVLEIARDEKTADLQAWVSVDNRSGATYDDAGLLLVAGDINQAPPQRLVMAEMADYGAKAVPAGFAEESLFDYHLYTLQRPTTLKDNQIKQISLFEAEGLGVRKIYRLDGSPQYFRSVGPLVDKPGVDVRYAFENRRENRLGMPLPAGVVRVYGRSAEGSRQLLGEDRIGHTAKDEEVELLVGRAFDIVAERVRTDSRRVSDRVYRHTFAITLRNHKSAPVAVEVVENVGGFWEILDSSLAFSKRDANTIAFDVPVPADGETVLTYTVQVTY